MNDNPIDRRTILKTAAWAAPVVAISFGVPAASASERCPAYPHTISEPGEVGGTALIYTDKVIIEFTNVPTDLGLSFNLLFTETSVNFHFDNFPGKNLNTGVWPNGAIVENHGKRVILPFPPNSGRLQEAQFARWNTHYFIYPGC